MNERTADECLRRVIELSREMIDLASAGDACRADAGCGIVFGTLRDKAYKVRKLAESELQRHQETRGIDADDEAKPPSKTEDAKPS
jgi:hypothetical protein